MDQMNRRSAIALGAAALAGVAALPLMNRVASGEEEHYRHMKLHRAWEALRDAKVEIEEAHHEWGGQKREAIESIDRAMHHLELLRDWHE